VVGDVFRREVLYTIKVSCSRLLHKSIYQLKDYSSVCSVNTVDVSLLLREPMRYQLCHRMLTPLLK
jgi:hypothetical protein